MEDSNEQAAAADELADAHYNASVGIRHLLGLSNALDLDITSTALGRLQTFEHRHPAD